MYYLVITALLVITLNSCEKSALQKSYTFDKVPGRTWIGEDFWSIPPLAIFSSARRLKQ